MWSNWNSQTLLQGMKNGTIPLQNCLTILNNGNFIRLPYDSEISLLCICPREIITYIHPKKCIRIFFAALFIKATNWTRPKCLSTDGCVNKLWCSHTIACCSRKRNKLLIQATNIGYYVQDEHQIHWSEQIKPDKRDYILYLVSFIRHTKTCTYSSRR